MLYATIAVAVRIVRAAVAAAARERISVAAHSSRALHTSPGGVVPGESTYW